MSKVCVYSLATQHENLGDLLINRELVRKLKKHFTVIIENSSVPDWFLDRVVDGTAIRASDDKKRYSIKSYQFYIRNLLGSKTIDVIAVSPGHYGDSTLKKDVKRILILLMALFYKSRGIRLFRVGVSFGRLSAIGSLLEALTVMMFDVYAVRDETSRSGLAPFAKKRCIVIPDLSFLAYEEISKYENKEQSRPDAVLISFRGDRKFPGVSRKYEETIYRTIPSLLPSLFESVICYAQVEFDQEVMIDTHKIMKALVEASYKSQCQDLGDALSIVSPADVVVSNRLHVLLPALMLGKLAIAVGSEEFDMKIFSIYRDIGLGQLIFDIDVGNAEFTCFIKGVIDNKDILKIMIRDAIMKQYENINLVLDAAFRIQ